MADYTPVNNPGNEITLTASAAITGGQVVVVTGSGTVGPAGVDAVKTVGVAAFDAAAGARVTVFAEAMVHETPASGVVAAGDFLVTAAAGTVSTKGAATNVVGLALTGGTGPAVIRWVRQ